MDNRERWKLIGAFDSTYWSGLDIAVYANNIHVEEALQLNYQIVEQVRPYYSYDSYVPDKLHHGTRIVSGELSLNFKRHGYLFSLLNLLRNQNSKDVWLPESPVITEPTGDRVRPPQPIVVQQWGPQAASKIANGEISEKAAYDFVQKKLQANNEGTVNKKPAVVPQNFGMFQTHENGFDLNIIFGGSLDSALALRFIADSDRYYADGAVIDDGKNVNVATGIKLIGVEIMGINHPAGDDGRPIIETYSFMAKDVQILSAEDIEGPGKAKAKSKAQKQVDSPTNPSRISTKKTPGIYNTD